MHLDSRTWNYWFFDSNSFSLCSNIVHVAHRYKTQVTRICCTGRLLSLITKRARSCRVWQASPWIGNRPSNIDCLPWAVVSHTKFTLQGCQLFQILFHGANMIVPTKRATNADLRQHKPDPDKLQRCWSAVSCCKFTPSALNPRSDDTL